jgi:hypothetical protein
MQKFYLHALDQARRGFDDVYDLDSLATITISPILVQAGNYILADRPKMTGRSMQLQKTHIGWICALPSEAIAAK